MATLEQIEAKMKKLQSRAEALIAKQSSAVLANIRALMDKHGLTTADIDAHVGGAQKRGRKPGASAANGKAKATATAKGGLPPKYRDPKTGATWSGHARPPVWIKDVKDRTRFLIAGDAAPVVPANVVTASKTKTTVKNSAAVGSGGAHSGQRKGPQPAKYCDPKSGATWSGRGPAPAWLAAVKDRTRFLIEGASAVTTETGAVNKASKSNAAGKNGAITKKTADNKVVAKKVPAAKQVVATKNATAKKAPATKNLAPAGKKLVARKATSPAIKKVVVKKAPAKKAVAKTVVATPDVVVAPETAALEATA
ncbi:H-NS family nucleoid-associated regulatory protein [Paraburkholderia sp. BL10I2N1]|uniref:H-NS histone family protein n=1 Tax=Paraburkholderia sp. BL10I2N1 TaxID=1938796 RepID=UPI001060543C|nr:H-NS family nucleoid-associated regulatory protein [Paraburkholderia sp. BL10I2N1]TDN67114.1 DNA-binding protein H-NS [Paraburkholderia sp. BL10I2N1]